MKYIEVIDKIEGEEVHKGPSHLSSCGVFIDTVRDFTSTKSVVSLAFEAYKAIAVTGKRQLIEVVTGHALGLRQVGKPVFNVGASSAHKNACFKACRYIIDPLKECVPIWEKEVFSNKSVWVSVHP